MYSTDREEALKYTLSSLMDMPGYLEAQKTLVVDGCMEGHRPQDWGIVEVPRFDNKFSWGNMWDAGVGSAAFDIVLYLDSDRLFPPDFLNRIVKSIEKDTFLFTSQHFMILEDMSVEKCKMFLRKASIEGVLMDDDYFGKLQYDPRWPEPIHGPGKNVMSGGTAFLKETYYKAGPVDPWYCGHGAYADVDYHYQAKLAGCKFLDLRVPELHYHHDKKDDGKKLDERSIRLKGLNNFIYYVWKWGLSTKYAENLAHNLSMLDSRDYISKKMAELDQQVEQVAN
jgi:hypothetical protein